MLARRSILGSGLTLIALAGGAKAFAAQTGMAKMAAGSMTLDDCVRSCVASHQMCLETARYCTQRGGNHVAERHLALLLDCAEMCQTTANSLLRRSPQHAVICEACARICEACASDCAAFAQDRQMQRCATTCRDCAASCRDMAKMPL